MIYVNTWLNSVGRCCGNSGLFRSVFIVVIVVRTWWTSSDIIVVCLYISDYYMIVRTTSPRFRGSSVELI